MFRKTTRTTETQTKTETYNNTYSEGSRVKDLPTLIKFTYEKLPLPEDYLYPFRVPEGYSSTHLRKSYATKIFLPEDIF